jgi:hypothetical protein
MSGPVTSLKRRGTMGIVPSRAIAALALVLVAAACGSSSSPASPKVRATSTTGVKPTAPSTTDGTAARLAGSIKLHSEPGVTPVQLQRAESLIATTMSGLRRFQTPAQAYAAGYRSIGDAVTGDEHYVNWSYANDGHILDPARPESVVYEVKNGKQTAVAAMYGLPFGSSFADVPDVGGALTQWHVHRDLCLTSSGTQRFVTGITTQDGTCPPGTSKLGDTPMLHVWTIPNPCGPFAALEGIGAGQVPAGQTRNCDTTNASVP